MPSAKFAGKFLHDGLPAMAAAYLFHLAKNHAFLDGNKRTALAVTEVFLRLNGCRLNATDDQLERLTQGVAEGSVSKESAAEFFRLHVA
jgi:death-on-curing protein